MINYEVRIIIITATHILYQVFGTKKLENIKVNILNHPQVKASGYIVVG